MDAQKIRSDFALFERVIDGKPVVYLDSAATSLKPRQVVEALRSYYEDYTANIHRGVHVLSEEASEAYEVARRKVAAFIGGKEQELVFTRNATEAINLVEFSWARQSLEVSDEIVCTLMDHHANVLPWQRLEQEIGVKVRYVRLQEDGALDMDNLTGLLNEKTKLVVLPHVSNVLGSVNEIANVCELVKRIHANAKVLVDGAQAVPHMPVDVSALGCDFYVFSGHKMLGPTGIGALWGRYELLQEMVPYQVGGEMITEVTVEGATFQDPPHRFEAGTPHIAGAIGLGAAVDYLSKVGMEEVYAHTQDLVAYCLKRLKKNDNVALLGATEDRLGAVTFAVSGCHAHDVAKLLSEDGVFVRSGHHCTMPLHAFLEVEGSVRASFYLYNTKDDVDRLVESLEKAISVLKRQ